MNRTSAVIPGFFAAVTLAGTVPAHAATTVTAVTGSMSITQETCLQGLTTNVGDGENCMYDGGPAADAALNAGVLGEVTGPYNQIAYYDSLATPAAFQTTDVALARVLYAPAVGDGKIAQTITGSVTIDDNGDGFGANDLISFTLTLTSPGGGDIVRSYGASVVDKYSSMTQTLAGRVANSVNANGSGGFDYIIGSEGFPTLRTYSQAGPCLDQPFGSVECGHSFNTPSVEPDFWNGTSAAGLGLLEGNAGAKTVGSVTSLACIDSKSATGVESNDCKDSQVSYNPWVNGPCAVAGGCTLNESTVGAVRGAAEDVGWDNLLLKVSTDAAGQVIAVAGFNVDDYKVFGTTRCGDNTTGTGTYNAVCNSWTAGYFTAAAAPERDAVDDGPFVASEGVLLPIPVLANDVNFQDPVTVLITTPPTKGTALVVGSPGSAAGISISYTANIGATGVDTIVYQADDGTGSDGATVTIAIGVGANPDLANTRINTPVNINVGGNDVGFDNSVTVAINNDFSDGGAATVTAGNGGPAAGIVVAYTPAAAPNTATYTETFTYTIDDGVVPPFSSQVTVTVENLVPDSRDGVVAIDTAGVAPAGLAATAALPVGGGSLGDLPVTVTIPVQGGRGTAAPGVDGNGNPQITYTITDSTFLSGTDTFTYLVTDADGDNDAGVITVSVPDIDPVLADSFIVTGVNKVSAPLSPAITAGNGALEAHALALTGQGTHGTCALSAPADGTATIVYTPAPDFVGTDTCQLTLTDADNDAVAGPVSIKVTPRPETGGASAIGPWGLALLGAASFLRRRRRAAPGVARAWRTVPVTGAVAAMVAFFWVGQAAWGQAADEPASGPTIGEIVVTARKVEENLQEVPLAITAFDANTIEEKGITSLNDVAALTPGLSFFNAFGENLPVPVIRGIAPTDIFGQNNAAIYVDGVYISGREGLNFSQLDVERIEVLKGPQSALYGRNAFSGAINYVTKAPSRDFEAKTAVEVGNRDKVKGSASISGPILGENLRGRIAALYDDWDGSYENSLAPENDIGGYRFRSLQASLLWLPAADWTVNLSYYKSNDDIDEAATVSLPTNCEDRVGDNNSTVRLQNFCGEVPDIEAIPGLNGRDAIPKVAQATGEERELDRANLRIEWDLHEYGSISALTGYSDTEQNSVSDFSRSLGESQPFLYCANAGVEDPAVPNSCLGNPATERFLTGVYDRELGGETEEISQEFRFTSAQDQRLRYTVGGYWYLVDQKAYPGGPISTKPLPATNIGLAPFDPGSPEFAIGTAIFYTTFTPDGGIDPLGREILKDKTQGWALFTGADFDITDRLTARAELRYSQEAQDAKDYVYTECPDKTTSVGLCGDDVYDLRVTAPEPFLAPSGDCFLNDGDPDAEAIADCSHAGSARFDSVTGRIGLDFKLTDDWMVYGSVAYGEKPGGLQLATVNLANGGRRLITSTFDPEELTAYELGAKGSILDGRVTISSAVFYNDWKEIVLRQLREVDPETGELLEQPTAFNVNAGDADVWGLELETNVALTDNLTGRLTVGWADAELDNAAQDTFEAFPSYAPDGDLSGNKLLRQPEWLMSASLDYSHPLAGEWDWYIGGDANYQSGVYVGNENQGWLPEHTYVNTRLGLRSGQYTLEFWVRNLFDDNSAVAAFRDIYWANNDDLYAPYRNDSGARPNFDEFVPLRYSVTYPKETTWGLSLLMRFGAAVR